MKIFLSTSFSHKVNYDTGEVFPEFRAEIEALLKVIRNAGHEVFAAIEDEGWKIGDMTPADSAKFDIQKIDESDALLAILHDQPSAGVQWEIGYVDASGKKVYIISEDGKDIGYWNRAIEALGRVTRLPYSPGDLSEFEKAIKNL